MIRFATKDFHPDHVFDCGQCFRWDREENGSYTGIASGNIANISYKDGEVIIDGGGSEEFWRSYLDIDRDYGAIKAELKSRDETIGKAADFGHGIRILAQEPWETLISFIISQNNNIPRIKKNINEIACRFGTYAGKRDGREYYRLPDPETLARLGEGDLAPVKLGYRAGYLIKTAATVAEDNGKVYYEKLSDYCGVGPKVASCVALFSLGHLESFPIDTWVAKVMSHLYGIEDKKEMARFAKEKFGEYGGIAQQYLFYYMRSTGGQPGV